jgi:hypothetical protein
MQSLGHSKVASDNYDTADMCALLQGLLLFTRGQFVGVTSGLKTFLPFLMIAALALYFLRLWALVYYAALCAAMCLLLAFTSTCCGPSQSDRLQS